MMAADRTYLLATVKPWNLAAFERRRAALPGRWSLLTHPDDLDALAVSALAPRYVFFPHWSWIVPDAVIEAAECVLFHMTDVPYGRGGSPLQNLIARGHDSTQISAIRMSRELDSGPVYLKRPLALHGSAQSIFERAATVILDMIEHIVRTEPQAVPQQGEPVIFRRRTPDQSRLPQSGRLADVYNHIRMLDADGYPTAFLEDGEFRYAFSDAEQEGDRVTARVEISRKEPES